MMPMNIAIDGPVGAGKSSIADQVAQRLNILHLDTGAMYRAFGLYALRSGTDLASEAALSALAEDVDVQVKYENGAQRTLLFGEDVSELIRTGEVSAAASAVSKWPAVRRRMVRAQQEMARTADMLIDGRDIGTVVLRDSPCKIFLTAAAEERARRRYLQQMEKGDTVRAGAARAQRPGRAGHEPQDRSAAAGGGRRARGFHEHDAGGDGRGDREDCGGRIWKAINSR